VAQGVSLVALAAAARPAVGATPSRQGATPVMTPAASSVPVIPTPSVAPTGFGPAWWRRMGLSSSAGGQDPSRGRGFRLDPAVKLGSKDLQIRNPSLRHGVLVGLVPSINPHSPFGFRLETAFSRLYLPAGEAKLDHEGWAWSLGTGFGLDLGGPVDVDVRAVRSYHLSVDTALPVEEDAWTFTAALSFGSF